MPPAFSRICGWQVRLRVRGTPCSGRRPEPDHLTRSVSAGRLTSVSASRAFLQCRNLRNSFRHSTIGFADGSQRATRVMRPWRAKFWSTSVASQGVVDDSNVHAKCSTRSSMVVGCLFLASIRSSAARNVATASLIAPVRPIPIALRTLRCSATIKPLSGSTGHLRLCKARSMPGRGLFDIGHARRAPCCPPLPHPR